MWAGATAPQPILPPAVAIATGLANVPDGRGWGGTGAGRASLSGCRGRTRHSIRDAPEYEMQPGTGQSGAGQGGAELSRAGQGNAGSG